MRVRDRSRVGDDDDDVVVARRSRPRPRGCCLTEGAGGSEETGGWPWWPSDSEIRHNC